MHKKYWLTLSSLVFVVFSLISLNLSIKKSFTNKLKSGAVETQDTLRDGDIIFQISEEGQGKAIQLATGSKYTHVGIIFKIDGTWQVFEAVEPVRRISLELFKANGDSGRFVIKRLLASDSVLNMDKIANMKTYLNSQLGKHYDPYFNWGDEQIYCSELVWKCYRKIGISLSELKQLKTYDLSSPLVKKTLKERYGNNIPYQEKVVSPGDIFESVKLMEVMAN